MGCPSISLNVRVTNCCREYCPRKEILTLLRPAPIGATRNRIFCNINVRIEVVVKSLLQETKFGSNTIQRLTKKNLSTMENAERVGG